MRRVRWTLATAAAFAVTGLIVLSFADRSSRVTDRAVSGEIVAYDSATRMLTLRTDGGDDGFLVPVTAAVHEGTRRLSVSALPRAVGHRAKIWYRESGQHRTASQIRVSMPGGSGSDGAAQIPSR